MLLLLALDLLSFTLLAHLLLVHELAFTSTVRASDTSLGVHARSELLHFHLDSLAVTSATLADGRSVTSSDTVATCAEALTLNFNGEFVSIVEFFESHINLFHHGLYLLLLLLAAASSAEHSSEGVAATSSLAIEEVLTVLVVLLTLLGVFQDVVSSTQFLVCCRVSAFIGMFLNRSLSEDLLDLIRSSFLGNSKNFIQLAVVYLLLGAASAATTKAGEVFTAHAAHKIAEIHFYKVYYC